MSRLTRDGTAEPVSREQTLRHAWGQGNIHFPVQLTTSRIGNLTRLIHTLLYVMTIHTYIYNRSTVAHTAFLRKRFAFVVPFATTFHRPSPLQSQGNLSSTTKPLILSSLTVSNCGSGVLDRDQGRSSHDLVLVACPVAHHDGMLVLLLGPPHRMGGDGQGDHDTDLFGGVPGYARALSSNVCCSYAPVR